MRKRPVHVPILQASIAPPHRLPRNTGTSETRTPQATHPAAQTQPNSPANLLLPLARTYTGRRTPQQTFRNQDRVGLHRPSGRAGARGGRGLAQSSTGPWLHHAGSGGARRKAPRTRVVLFFSARSTRPGIRAQFRPCGPVPEGRVRPEYEEVFTAVIERSRGALLTSRLRCKRPRTRAPRPPQLIVRRRTPPHAPGSSCVPPALRTGRSPGSGSPAVPA